MPDPSFYRPSHSEYTSLDPSIKQELVRIQASDGGRSHGALYVPDGPRPKTAVMRTHPSGDLIEHWAAPYWTREGFGFFSLNTRYAGNYTPCIHEKILLDVAATVKYLREDCGFERVIFHGQSGGASCLSFYQAEATTPKGKRLSSPPAGGSPNLNEEDLPPADGLILVAGHPGQGRYLQLVIDPSVVDEDDPIATDPEFDMYDERNGWRPPPEESRYDRGWLAAYREAQTRRVARLDAVAWKAVESRRTAQALLEHPSFATLSQSRQRELERRAQLEKTMVLHRTEANPAYTDLSIEPNDRVYGSIQGPRPDLSNYGGQGFAKIVTAEAWLSTWSGLTSNAYLERNLARIKDPTFFVFPSGDQDIFPSQFRAQLEWSAAGDKDCVWLENTSHYFQPTTPDGDVETVRSNAIKLLGDWTRARFS
jgi:hypothetical protein